MPDDLTQPGITIRGRAINVPHSTAPNRTTRHQPDTPINKKFQPAAASKPKRRTKTKPTPAPDAPPDEGATPNEPTTTSETD